MYVGVVKTLSMYNAGPRPYQFNLSGYATVEHIADKSVAHLVGRSPTFAVKNGMLGVTSIPGFVPLPLIIM